VIVRAAGRLGAAGALILLATTAATAQSSATRLALSLEAGGEYDSNATRVPQDRAPVGSGLSRLLAGLGAATRLFDSQSISLSETIGAKVFFDPVANAEDVLVDDTHLLWSTAVTPSLQLQLGGDYYDAYQRGSTLDPGRDFRVFGGGPHLVFLGEGDALVTALFGYRAFQYKPDPDQSYQGPYFGLLGRKRWLTGPDDDEREWELAASYQLHDRAFQGPNFVSPSMFVSGSNRRDLFHTGELRLTWTGPLLLGLGYGVEWNDSTSYGFGLLRHIITFRFAAPLPGRIQLALRAVLQALQLSDPILLDPRQSATDAFDNENRSSVELALERPVSHGLKVVARYSFFTSVLNGPPATGGAADFYRHLVYAGLGYQLDR
jgi:hypothetical protein